MIKILTVLGARPQFIKAAALSRVMQANPRFKEVIVHTGQHFDINMSAVFFNELRIPKPTYNLNVNGLSHGAMTGQMLISIEEIILKEKPDYVLVYGDTNSTLSGALAASKLHVKIIHVEAGLRSFNMAMPEEINRIITDRISDLLCCPTKTAIKNLENEGFDKFTSSVVNTGDVMQDAALYYSDHVNVVSELESLNLVSGQFVLCTLHRPETTNFPDRLLKIINALKEIAANYIDVVIPLHPRTKAEIQKFDIGNIKIIEPVGYLSMIALLKSCKMVLTDSGGLQKEAYFFSKYCVTLRLETEWVELVEGGYNYLAGYDHDFIIKLFLQLQNKPWLSKEDLYGGGIASARICDAIEGHFDQLKLE
jgi:UDP-GlcNAc3NAcA epimerase